MTARTAPGARRAVVWVALLVASACGSSGGSGPSGPAPGVAAPDFALLDVNPASASAGLPVSVRGLLGRVSAWYFGHAT